ncbi:MFS transporter [Actinoplanes sp. NPDC051411]|uniref:MFS transporter n=1 Tax=Actinoplanes sp. NPDC051411 TaxID=3155522 RepID=UPI00343CFABE
MFAITNCLDQALLTLLLPVWFHAHGYTAADIGDCLGLFGAAAACTALLSTAVGHRLPRRPTYLTAIIVSGISRFVVLAADAPLPAIYTTFAVAGLASGIVGSLILSLQIERIPYQVRGRVLTLINTGAWTGIPLGGLTAAALTALAGTTGALWLAAGGYLAAVLDPYRHLTPDRTTTPAAADSIKTPRPTPATASPRTPASGPPSPSPSSYRDGFLDDTAPVARGDLGRIPDARNPERLHAAADEAWVLIDKLSAAVDQSQALTDPPGKHNNTSAAREHRPTQRNRRHQQAEKDPA